MCQGSLRSHLLQNFPPPNFLAGGFRPLEGREGARRSGPGCRAGLGASSPHGHTFTKTCSASFLPEQTSTISQAP